MTIIISIYMYNGEFQQYLEVIVISDAHNVCLLITNHFKKLCDDWSFNVKYDEHKSTRKGNVLSRRLMIYQTAYASDILIFKESVRRISEQFATSGNNVRFLDRDSEPKNNLRQSY